MTSVDEIDIDMCLLPLADTDDVKHFDPSACTLRKSIKYCVVQKLDAFHRSTGHSPVKGQVGLTCVFCRDVPTKEKVGASGAISFPGSIDHIYTNATGAVKR